MVLKIVALDFLAGPGFLGFVAVAGLDFAAAANPPSLVAVDLAALLVLRSRRWVQILAAAAAAAAIAVAAWL